MFLNRKSAKNEESGFQVTSKQISERGGKHHEKISQEKLYSFSRAAVIPSTVSHRRNNVTFQKKKVTRMTWVPLFLCLKDTRLLEGG